MPYYDYERVPEQVADAAFADFLHKPQQKDILDLIPELIRHCDAWCEASDAYSERDQRVAVLLRLQTYIHTTYAAELSRLMKDNIRQYQQREEIMSYLYERRN
ncbi:hypothetical protein EKD04_020605 [Chloroflexales bacterium ZM16-3]|nr:hypothetical protein [Chloroflexales bacterium ZM16-3]